MWRVLLRRIGLKKKKRPHIPKCAGVACPFLLFLAGLWACNVSNLLCFMECMCAGKALRRDMGEVWRILQQEEHNHVWRYWTKLSHESTEWIKGIRPLLLSSSSPSPSSTHFVETYFLWMCVRSDPLWRPISTGKRTGNFINWLSTSKKLPSLMTSVDSTINTGRGRYS